MLFDKFILRGFLWIFLSVSIAGVFLVSLYALTDFIIGFKVKDPEIGLKYFLHLIPIGFYYISPMLFSIALLVFLKRTIEKKIDLIIQSFSISPFRFSLPILLFSLVISFLFIVGNQFLFPQLAERLWFIEKTFKKKQDIEGIIRNFWFLKKENNNNNYYFIEYLDLKRKKFINFFLLSTKNYEPVEYLKALKGIWLEENIFIEKGFKYNFTKEKLSLLNYKSINIGLDVKDLELFSERIAFLPLYDLYKLIEKGRKWGYNPNIYVGEILFRINFSFLPFVISGFIIFYFLKTRSLKRTLFTFLTLFPFIWIAVILPKIGTQKANQSLVITVIPSVIIYLLLLKGIYDLRKGFRL